MTQSDLLVINKTDLADAVGADLKVRACNATYNRDMQRAICKTEFCQVRTLGVDPRVRAFPWLSLNNCGPRPDARLLRAHVGRSGHYRLFRHQARYRSSSRAAEHSWQVMERDAAKMRGAGAVVFSQAKHGVGVDEIVSHILRAWQTAAAGTPRRTNLNGRQREDETSLERGSSGN